MKLQCERTSAIYLDSDVNHAPEIEIHVAELRYVQSLKSWWIHLIPGVTGYESAGVDDLLRHDDSDSHGWSACAGTKNSWDKLYVPPSEMKRLLDALRLLQPVLKMLPISNENPRPTI